MERDFVFQQLGQFLQLPYQFAGRVENKGQADIMPDQIKVAGAKKSTDLIIKSVTGQFSAPLITSDYILTYLKKQQTLNIASINVDTGFGKFDHQARRSITPAGFAKAFYEANQ